MFRGAWAPSQRQRGPQAPARHAPRLRTLGGAFWAILPAGQRDEIMLVATTENLAGHRTVKVLGQCFGVVVRSRGIGGNIVAGLRSIIGGEIKEYTQLLEEARRHAVDCMVSNAALMGANA